MKLNTTTSKVHTLWAMLLEYIGTKPFIEIKSENGEHLFDHICVDLATDYESMINMDNILRVDIRKYDNHTDIALPMNYISPTSETLYEASTSAVLIRILHNEEYKPYSLHKAKWCYGNKDEIGCDCVSKTIRNGEECIMILNYKYDYAFGEWSSELTAKYSDEIRFNLCAFEGYINLYLNILEANLSYKNRGIA